MDIAVMNEKKNNGIWNIFWRASVVKVIATGDYYVIGQIGYSSIHSRSLNMW